MSHSFERKSVSSQFADKLLGDIQRGVFGPLLPSIRQLVDRYGLNPVSVHRAVGKLVRDGVLVSRGPRRRMSIAPSPSGSTVTNCLGMNMPSYRALIFLGADPSELSSTLVLATQDVQLACRAKGGSCSTVVLAGLSDERKVALVKAALLEHKPTHVLLLYCDQLVYRFVIRRVKMTAVLGGTIKGRGVIDLAVDNYLLAVAALDDLRRLGHRKFRLMMLGRPGSSRLRKSFRQFSMDNAVDFDVVFRGKLSLASMSRELDLCLRTGVTAFFFPRPEDLVLANAYFESVNVVVPRDISVVLLLSGPYDFMRSRQPAHFKVSKANIASLVLGWFEFGENRSGSVTREVITSYNRGMTVAAARK